MRRATGVAFWLAVLLLCGIAAASGTPLVRIGLVADNHYDTFPAGEKAPWQPMKSWLEGQKQRTTTTTKRRYDIAKDKMLEAVDVFNRADNVTFVVNLGDLVNNDLMWNLKPILDAFNTVKRPHFSIVGNHDLRAHNDRFGKNNKTQEAWIRGKLGLGEHWYYAFSYPPFHFVFLDSMLLDEKHDPKRAVHIKWVEEQLKYAESKHYAVIVFGHISIGLGTNVLGPTLKSYEHVVGAFFGHEHRGGYVKQGHLHTTIINGQIETMTNAFAMLDVFIDRMELTGFGRVPTRVMPFTNDATTAMLRQHTFFADHDALDSVGHTPEPPEKLWRNEQLQVFPPLELNLPGYRKPMLRAAEPNPGSTAFANEYKTWPHRVLTHAPEDPVDLLSHTGQRHEWLRYPLDGAARRDVRRENEVTKQVSAASLKAGHHTKLRRTAAAAATASADSSSSGSSEGADTVRGVASSRTQHAPELHVMTGPMGALPVVIMLAVAGLAYTVITRRYRRAR